MRISQLLTNKVIFLMVVNLFLLLVGCFLDIFSAILIVLPILLPIVEQYHIDPYHFAIVFLVNLEMGYLTPPVGMNLFIASYRFKQPITRLYRSSLPFLGWMFVGLMVLTYVPVLSTFWVSAGETDEPVKTGVVTDKVVGIEVVPVGVDAFELHFMALEGVRAYEVRYSDFEMKTDADLDFSEGFLWEESLSLQGTLQVILVENLKAGRTYTVSIRGVYEGSHLGSWSDFVKVKVR